LLLMRDTLDPEAKREILNHLCQAYWQPLFQYARRLGNTPEESQDLTQGFFLHLLRNGLFGSADPQKGRLRTLLLSSFSNFIRAEYNKSTALKRGGAQEDLSLNQLENAEMAYQLEAGEAFDPIAIYNRRFARDCLAAAAARLELRYTEQAKRAHYDSLKQFITASGTEGAYAVEAAKLNIRADYYKVLVHRFREHFKEALTAHIRETMPDDVTDEEVQQEIIEIIRLAFAV
jgi:DNA-directed RNA polymerase specialized sigma24 family protein